jgi:death-on-curing protein
MPILYLTLDQAIEVHRKTVEVSGGGAMGYLNLGNLESVLNFIRNDDYYPTFTDKLTHLFFSRVISTVFKTAISVSRSLFVPKCCL